MQANDAWESSTKPSDREVLAAMNGITFFEQLIQRAVLDRRTRYVTDNFQCLIHHPNKAMGIMVRHFEALGYKVDAKIQFRHTDTIYMKISWDKGTWVKAHWSCA